MTTVHRKTRSIGACAPTRAPALESGSEALHVPCIVVHVSVRDLARPEARPGGALSAVEYENPKLYDSGALVPVLPQNEISPA